MIEEGSDSGLEIDASGAQRAKEILSADEQSHKGLRLYIAGKDCDGFLYGVCTGDPEEEDLCFESRGIVLFCDQASYGFIRGAHVSWVDDERGQGFLVQNPRHKQFRGKFFKKSSWQENL